MQAISATHARRAMARVPSMAHGSWLTAHAAHPRARPRPKVTAAAHALRHPSRLSMEEEDFRPAKPSRTLHPLGICRAACDHGWIRNLASCGIFCAASVLWTVDMQHATMPPCHVGQAGPPKGRPDGRLTRRASVVSAVCMDACYGTLPFRRTINPTLLLKPGAALAG
ncbi:hypothetical protein K431DRAFT_20338 [Polychaeton citri CBS 116435]|uniref:Uncharacterized protein n=1 Tax=Polychaeton citri CBS 116435 TaxID=1314669 RepID=A0A9P4PWQ2_9PEZI|nr:hypothetical protein K431DRAFT_20338 [Polychaeton citri CBS 116435]